MYRNPESEPHIKRIDARGTHGFQFHVERGEVLLTRLFSDLICGGKDVALDRARAYRDKILPQMPKSKNRGPRSGVSRSNSGAMGISITEDQNADGTVRIYAQATARPPGGKTTTKSIRLDSDTDIITAIRKLTRWRKKVYSGEQF